MMKKISLALMLALLALLGCSSNSERSPVSSDGVEEAGKDTLVIKDSLYIRDTLVLLKFDTTVVSRLDTVVLSKKDTITERKIGMR